MLQRPFLLLIATGGLLLLNAAACVPPASPPPGELPAERTPVPAKCPIVNGEPVHDLVAELVLGDGAMEFAAGEAIAMSLTITNCSDAPVIRHYSDSQQFDFVVSDDEGQEVWRWSDGFAFLQILMEQTLQPDESVTYTEIWDQNSDDAQPVSPGRYQVLGIDVGCKAERQDCDFGMGLSIEITP